MARPSKVKEQVKETVEKTAVAAKGIVEEKVAPAVKKAVKETKAAIDDKITELNTEVYVQFAGKEITPSAVVENAKKAYAAEGHRISSIKDIKVYIKPEDNCAYYVVNGKNAGKVEL